MRGVAGCARVHGCDLVGRPKYMWRHSPADRHPRRFFCRLSHPRSTRHRRLRVSHRHREWPLRWFHVAGRGLCNPPIASVRMRQSYSPHTFSCRQPCTTVAQGMPRGSCRCTMWLLAATPGTLHSLPMTPTRLDPTPEDRHQRRSRRGSLSLPVIRCRSETQVDPCRHGALVPTSWCCLALGAQSLPHYQRWTPQYPARTRDAVSVSHIALCKK